MKKYIAVYDSTKTYLFNNMTQATPEIVARDYTSVNLGVTCVFETDSTGLMFKTAPIPLMVLAGQYDIDTSNMTEEEILSSLNTALNKEEETVDTHPTAEERIAAALEYQNLTSI